MAIEFRSAITIDGVNVAPGYPLLSGLTAGQFLRASDGTTVAFAALIAADLPDVLDAHGVRAARGANADGLWVAWQAGDTLSTFHAGGSNSSNDRIAVYGESYSSEGVRGTSTSGVPIFGIRSDTSTNGSSSGMRVSHRSSGVIVAGLGVEINFMLQSTTTPDMEAARISAVWTDPTHIGRTGDLLFGTTLSGTTATAMRLTSAAQLGLGTIPTERLHLVSGGILIDSSGSLTANSEVAIGFKVTSGGGWARQIGWLATGNTSLGGFGAYGAIQVMNYLYIGTSYNAAIAHFYANKSTALRVADGTVAAGLYVPRVAADALPTIVAGASTAGNNQIAVKGISDSSQALWGESTSGEGVRGYIPGSLGTPIVARRTGTAGNALLNMLILDIGATAGVAGFGNVLLFKATSDTTGSRDQASIASKWEVAADATRTANLSFWTTNSAAWAERMRLTGAGHLILGATDIAVLGAGRTFLAIRGSTEGGAIELSQTAADANAANVGLIQFADRNSTAADKRVSAIVGITSGATANNRGGAILFYTKLDNVSGILEKMRLTAEGQLLLRSTDSSQAAGGYFPWVASDTLAALIGGSGGSHSTTGIIARAGTGLGLYAGVTTGTPFFGERTASTLTNTTADLLVIKHTAATPASVTAGFGVAINFQLSSTTTAGRSAAKIGAVWSDPADATYTGDITFLTANSTTMAEKMRLTGLGALWIGRSSGGLTGAGDLDVLGNVIIGGTFSLPTKTANTVFAGPTSGGAAVPAFRALVALDLPATAVAAGVYTNANITVDAQGRLTSAATGAVVSIPTSVVGYLPFYGTTTTLASDATLFWDNTNKRLGIGTVAPDVALHILGANIGGADLITGLKLDRLYGSVGDQMSLDFGDTTSSSSGAARIAVNAWAGGESAILFFAQTAAGNGFTNEVMRIRGDGKVGIGTNAPAAPLHVMKSNVETFRLSASAGHGVSMMAYNPGSQGDHFYLTTNAYFTGAAWAFHNTSYLSWMLSMGGASGDTLQIQRAPAAGVPVYANLLTLTSAGYLGLGTNAPSLQLESKMSSVYPAINVQEASSSTRRATIGFGVNGVTATTGWIMGQSLGNNTVKDFYLNDATAGATRLFIDTAGFVGLGITSSLAATLHVVRPQAVQLRLESLAGSGTTMMAYSTGTVESLYIMVNRTYEASAFSRIDTSQPSWTLSMGSQDQDTFKLYRQDAAGTLSTLLQLDASGNLETIKGGTIRAVEGTYAAPAGGAGCELASTGGAGYVQSYNRATSAWRPLNINASSITFGGGVAWGSFNASGNLQISGRLIPEGSISGYVGTWGTTSIYTNGNLLVGSAVFPGNQGSYYLAYTTGPAGLVVYRNLSCYHDIFPGNNNGTGASLNASYYWRGETNNAGLRTNGAILVSGNIWWGTGGNWLSVYINQQVLSSSSPQFANIGVSAAALGNVRVFVVGASAGSGDYNNYWNNSSSVNIFYVRNDGAGYFKSTAWAYSSDARLKENIAPLGYGLAALRALRPVIFDYINGEKRQYGLLAQQVLPIMPELVETMPGGMYGLKTTSLIPVTILAIQELADRVEYLERELALLRRNR